MTEIGSDALRQFLLKLLLENREKLAPDLQLRLEQLQVQEAQVSRQDRIGANDAHDEDIQPYLQQQQ